MVSLRARRSASYRSHYDTDCENWYGFCSVLDAFWAISSRLVKHKTVGFARTAIRRGRQTRGNHELNWERWEADGQIYHVWKDIIAGSGCRKCDRIHQLAGDQRSITRPGWTKFFNFGSSQLYRYGSVPFVCIARNQCPVAYQSTQKEKRLSIRGNRGASRVWQGDQVTLVDPWSLQYHLLSQSSVGFYNKWVLCKLWRDGERHASCHPMGLRASDDPSRFSLSQL